MYFVVFFQQCWTYGHANRIFQCTCAAFVVFFAIWFCIISFTFLEDAKSVENSPSGHNQNKADKSITRHFAFLQVIVENALVMEWLHIAFNALPYCCQKLNGVVDNGQNFQ